MPKSTHQRNYVEAIRGNDLVFGIGPAVLLIMGFFLESLSMLLIMVPVAMLASLGFTALGPRRVTAAVLCLALGTTVAVFNWVKIWHFNPYERLQDWHTLAMYEIEGTSPQHSIALIFSREDPRSYLLEKMVTTCTFSVAAASAAARANR